MRCCQNWFHIAIDWKSFSFWFRIMRLLWKSYPFRFSVSILSKSVSSKTCQKTNIFSSNSSSNHLMLRRNFKSVHIFQMSEFVMDVIRGSNNYQINSFSCHKINEKRTNVNWNCLETNKISPKNEHSNVMDVREEIFIFSGKFIDRVTPEMKHIDRPAIHLLNKLLLQIWYLFNFFSFFFLKYHIMVHQMEFLHCKLTFIQALTRIKATIFNDNT